MLARIDIGIIVGYLLFVTVVGLVLSRRASNSIDEYFLGGRSIAWWLLGISGMATFIDIGGTAYQCAWFYMFGAKGFWFCIEGAVALLLAFQMIYVAKWLNRSGCMTNAQWMTFRFGRGWQGETARVVSAISVLVICVGMMVFFFEGAGKVLVRFIPIFNGNENLAGIAFFVLVGMYTVASGFYGVIYTDLIQAFLILALIVYIGVKAFMLGTPEYFATHAPPGWLELFPSDGDWAVALPERFADIAAYAEKAKFLGVLILFWLLNNIMMGMATPFDAWTAQRYYAAKNERESCLIPCEWIGLWSLRFILMAGIGVLAIGVSDQIMHPEKALSVVITELLPVGIKGMLLAGLLAAGMSTIDSTVNSSAAYFVKDIYQEFIRPKATMRHLVIVSYVVTALLMASGVLLGLYAENISAVWGWIMMGLFTGTLPPNILKWFWWRTNGLGFAGGTLFGLTAAIVTQTPWVSGLNTWETWLVITAASTVGSVLGILIGSPPDMEVLTAFYKKTKPFGWWKPVRAACDPGLVKEIQRESRRDAWLVPVACVWQLSLFLMMALLVLKLWTIILSCACVFAVLSVVLYRFWYRNLKVCT